MKKWAKLKFGKGDWSKWDFGCGVEVQTWA